MRFSFHISTLIVLYSNNRTNNFVTQLQLLQLLQYIVYSYPALFYNMKFG